MGEFVNDYSLIYKHRRARLGVGAGLVHPAREGDPAALGPGTGSGRSRRGSAGCGCPGSDPDRSLPSSGVFSANTALRKSRSIKCPWRCSALTEITRDRFPSRPPSGLGSPGYPQRRSEFYTIQNSAFKTQQHELR